MENFGKKWFSTDLAHFLMAQPYKILVPINRMFNPLTVQILFTCDHFNMHFYSFFAKMYCNPRFWKTRPDTQLPKSRAGGQGPHLRSVDHLGKSSEVQK